MGIFSSALGAIHAALSVTATALGEDFKVIDKTSGVEVDSEKGGIKVPTVIPAAAVRVAALAAVGLTAAELVGQTITFNSKTWRCYSTLPRSTPEGESNAEVLLLLRKA